MWALIIAFLFGLIVGSFLNVCIHRLPRGESIVSPPSHCPRCGKTVTWKDNIPVLSYLLLRGRCRACGEAISIRYPLVELLTAVLSGFVFLLTHSFFLYLVYFSFAAALLVITVIDLEHRIIPNVISLPGAVAGFFLSFFVPGISWVDSLLGIAAGAGTILLVIAAYYLLTRREGMGIGDAKLLAMIGAFLGWKGALFALVGGSLLGSLAGLSLMIFKGFGRQSQIPFGPFLAIGALFFLFIGPDTVLYYLNLLMYR